MARPRNYNEDQILEGAVAIFRERGYEGASVPELISKLGICRQSLYNTFGDKRGLYLKALERWGQLEVDTKLELLTSEGSPLDNVRTLIRSFAAMATTCPSDGCLTATAMVESRQDPDALAVVELQVERFEIGIRTALEEAQVLGELRDDVRPGRLARALTTASYGMGLLTRLPGSGPRIADAVSVLLDILEDAAA
jgi:TetR/AcrR family transcriptional repressor of nem operon